MKNITTYQELKKAVGTDEQGSGTQCGLMRKSVDEDELLKDEKLCEFFRLHENTIEFTHGGSKKTEKECENIRGYLKDFGIENPCGSEQELVALWYTFIIKNGKTYKCL